MDKWFRYIFALVLMLSAIMIAVAQVMLLLDGSFKAKEGNDLAGFVFGFVLLFIIVIVMFLVSIKLFRKKKTNQ